MALIVVDGPEKLDRYLDERAMVDERWARIVAARGLPAVLVRDPSSLLERAFYVESWLQVVVFLGRGFETVKFSPNGRKLRQKYLELAATNQDSFRAAYVLGGPLAVTALREELLALRVQA